MPMLVLLKEHTLPSGETVTVPDRYVRASDLQGKLDQANNPEWKTVAFDEAGNVVLPNGAIGFRWGPDGRADQGQWNLEARDARSGAEVKLRLSALDGASPSKETAKVAFPYFGGIASDHFPNSELKGVDRDVLVRTVPVQRIALGDEGDPRGSARCHGLRSTGRELRRRARPPGRARRHELRRRHAVHAGLAGAHHRHAASAGDHGGAPVCRKRAQDAGPFDGDHRRGDEPLVPLRHELPGDHQHADAVRLHRQERRRLGALRGQEKLRPQTGWTALAFALDWIRPPRQQNSTSFFYAHTDQWRYEKLTMSEVISPLADAKLYGGSMIDYNVRAERMGWLPSAPQLQTNPLQVVRDAQAAGADPKEYTVKGLKSGTLKMSCEDPDHPNNWPRNLFVWRSNLLARAARDTSTFSSTCSARATACKARISGRKRRNPRKSSGTTRRPRASSTSSVTLDFRMSTTCLYSGHRASDGDLVREERSQHRATCTRSSTRCRPQSTRRGNRAATGTSTRASRRSSAKCASATSASNARSC
jgi:nitrate reductase alpha subunit